MTEIGFREWRPISDGKTRESWLSTRCGIRAPGHSAGNVSLLTPRSGVWNRVVWKRERVMERDAMHSTRAEAAAAAYEVDPRI